jgi:hypothetical protein
MRMLDNIDWIGLEYINFKVANDRGPFFASKVLPRVLLVNFFYFFFLSI